MPMLFENAKLAWSIVLHIYSFNVKGYCSPNWGLAAASVGTLQLYVHMVGKTASQDVTATVICNLFPQMLHFFRVMSPN